jgi:hypothetical protein
MAAFMPGASPPLVRIPILLITVAPESLCVYSTDGSAFRKNQFISAYVAETGFPDNQDCSVHCEKTYPKTLT